MWFYWGELLGMYKQYLGMTQVSGKPHSFLWVLLSGRASSSNPGQHWALYFYLLSNTVCVCMCVHSPVLVYLSPSPETVEAHLDMISPVVAFRFFLCGVYQYAALIIHKSPHYVPSSYGFRCSTFLLGPFPASSVLTKAFFT